MATLTIRKNKDNTITVKYHKYVEFVSLESKSPTEILESVRYCAITAGVSVSEEEIWLQLQSELYK